MHFTIQVSNHRDAGKRVPSAAAVQSWTTVYNGQIATAKEARQAVDQLARWYKHVRVFKGVSVGRLHYAVLRSH